MAIKLAPRSGNRELDKPRLGEGIISPNQLSARQSGGFQNQGKKYRLVVRINYRRGIVSARFFGTRAEYGRINAEEV